MRREGVRGLALGWLAALALAGCGGPDYSRLRPGEFSGKVLVMWVGEGDEAGDGAFVFAPDPDDPLVFTRGTAAPGEEKTVDEIRPGLMYTDGGSIPKAGQVFRGLSPWGYAPAYMVHDWVYQARHCVKDGRDDGTYSDLARVGFREQAAILGEAIRTLIEERRVRPDDAAPAAITWAVGSPVSRALWDKDGACPVPSVSDAHRAEVEAVFRGRNLRVLDRAFRTAPGAPRPRPARTAQVVAVISF